MNIKGISHTTYKVYDKNGKLKKIITKPEEKNITESEWLKGVSCFVINEKQEVLIEKRVNKGLTPGKIDLCSGHIDNNEVSTQAMIRELKEELGIELNQSINVAKLTKEPAPLIFESSGKYRNFFIDFYCLRINNPIIKFQKSEIDNILWLPIEKCFELIQSGKTKFPKEYNYEKIFESVRNLINYKKSIDKER